MSILERILDRNAGRATGVGAAGDLTRQFVPVFRERYDAVLLDRSKPHDIEDIIESTSSSGGLQRRLFHRTFGDSRPIVACRAPMPRTLVPTRRNDQTNRRDSQLFVRTGPCPSI